MRFTPRDTEFKTTSYFDEKAQQLSIGYMEAFGVGISSRYCKADEMIEMINLARDLEINNLADFVYQLFYDSKANCLCVEYMDDDLSDYFSDMVENLAEKHITQFITKNGTVKHKIEND